MLEHRESVTARQQPARRARPVYRVTDEQSGEVLRTVEVADVAKGETGALYAAARAAAAYQREGRTVILEGPAGFATRRYAPEYVEGGKRTRWPFRVRGCSVPGCLNWMHPTRVKPGATCREHFREAPATKARADHMNQARQQRQQ